MTGHRTLFDLDGRIALVTGGSRGLGLQIAEALGDYGAAVMVSARRQHELDAALERLRGRGIRAEACAVDLAAAGAAETLAEATLAAFGAIDVLVNNAGASWGAPAEDHPLDAWDKVVAAKTKENPLMQKVLDSQREFAQRAGQWQNDYVVDYKMAWNRYFSKAQPKKA